MYHRCTFKLESWTDHPDQTKIAFFNEHGIAAMTQIPPCAGVRQTNDERMTLAVEKMRDDAQKADLVSRQVS